MSASFLTFDIAGTAFAVDANRVEEVAEAARATRLPFAAPHVEGLANVAGRILPVFDLAGRPAPGVARNEGKAGEGQGSEGQGGGPLVVLRAGDGSLALRVGRVGGTLPEERVTRAPPALEDSGLPVAARLTEGDRSLRLLDPDRLNVGHGLDLPTTTGDRRTAGAGTGDAAAPPAPARGRAGARLLIVEAGGHAHALDMAEIRLVFPVAELRPLPDAPALVCGMALAQRRPVLLADPLGTAPGAGGYAVVLATRCGPVAVRVDAVRGVVRSAPARVAEDGTGKPDAAVEQRGDRPEVKTAARLLDDRLEGIAHLIPADGDRTGHPPPRLFHRRFLTILVDGRIHALEFEKVRRVAETAGRLRLPRRERGGTGSFDGLADVDGVILPVLDLRRRLARAPAGSLPGGPGVAILLEIGGGTVAVTADAILRIRKVASDEVDPLADRLTAAMIRLDGALVPVLRPEGLAEEPAREPAGDMAAGSPAAAARAVTPPVARAG